MIERNQLGPLERLSSIARRSPHLSPQGREPAPDLIGGRRASSDARRVRGLSVSLDAWERPLTRSLRGVYHRAALRADPLAPASTSPLRGEVRRSRVNLTASCASEPRAHLPCPFCFLANGVA